MTSTYAVTAVPAGDPVGTFAFDGTTFTYPDRQTARTAGPIIRNYALLGMPMSDIAAALTSGGWSNGYLQIAAAHPPGPALTAAADVQDGAMVALIPTEQDAQRLAVDGGEPAEQMHCTMLYLGKASDIDDGTRDDIVDAVTQVAEQWEPLQAEVFSVNVFNPNTEERDTAIVYGLSGDDLDTIHQDLTEAVQAAPEQHQPWHAHMTAAYSDDLSLVAELAPLTGSPVTFDRIRVAFGGNNIDILLGGYNDLPPDLQDDTPNTGALAAADFVEAQHPRDTKGRFRSIGERVIAAIRGGMGRDDLNKAFTREQLRKVAKEQGVSLHRGASPEHIAEALLHRHGAGNKPAPKPGRVKAATTPAPTGKATLADVSSAASRIDAEALLKSHTKPELQALAQEAGVSFTGRATKPALVSAILDAAGHGDSAGGGLSPTEQRVMDAVTARADGPIQWTGLAELRSALDGSRQEQDQALLSLLDRGQIRLIPEENQKTITARDRAAAINISGEDKHLVGPNRPVPAGPVGPASKADGLDALADRQLRNLATEYEVPDARNKTRPQLLRALRKEGAVSPDVARANTPPEPSPAAPPKVHGINESVPLKGDPEGDNMRMHGDSVTMGLAQAYAAAGRNGSANRMMDLRRRATTSGPDGITPQAVVDELRAIHDQEQDPKFKAKLARAIDAVDAPARPLPDLPANTPPHALKLIQDLNAIPYARKRQGEQGGGGVIRGPSLVDQVAQVYRDAAAGQRDDSGRSPIDRIRNILRDQTHEVNEASFRIWSMTDALETVDGPNGREASPLSKELRAWERGQLPAAPTAPHLPDAGGLSVTERRIVDVVRSLEREPGGYVSVADVRDQLHGVPRAEVDAALTSLGVRSDVHVIPVANLASLTPRERAAALRMGGEDRHAISINPGFTAAEPAAPPTGGTKSPDKRMVSEPLLPNTWGGGGDITVHPDSVFGRLHTALGDDAHLNVGGHALGNVVGRIGTDAVRGNITDQQAVTQLQAIAAKLPAGSRAAALVANAASDLSAPARALPDLPAGTPHPVRELMGALNDIPVVRRGGAGGIAQFHETDQLADIMRRWEAGETGGRRLISEIQRLRDSRHESVEGSAAIRRKVDQAVAELEAMWNTDRASLNPPSRNETPAAPTATLDIPGLEIKPIPQVFGSTPDASIISLDGKEIGDVHGGGPDGKWVAFPDRDAKWRIKGNNVHPTKEAAIQALVDSYRESAGQAPTQFAHEHVDRIVREDEFGYLRHQPMEALGRQADLVPHTTMGLSGIGVSRGRSGGWGELAEYSPFLQTIMVSRNWKDSYARTSEVAAASHTSGFFTPTPDPKSSASTIAHEFGHHVAHTIGGGFSGHWSPQQAAQFFPSLERALGVPAGSIHKPSTKFNKDKVNTKLAGLSQVIKERISGYAAQHDHDTEGLFHTSQFDELLAEVWQEYSMMGDKARPYIAEMGRILAQLAEEAAQR